MKGVLILTTAAMLAAAIAAHAEAGDMPGNALQGRELAVRECSQCHRVSRAALPPRLLRGGPAFGDVPTLRASRRRHFSCFSTARIRQCPISSCRNRNRPT